jgi:mono/diheme cytochrome c family protein
MNARALLVLGFVGACVAGDDLEVQPGDPTFYRDPALDVANVSAHRTSRSHNVGQNCMRCHQERGPGRGRFAVAATVLGPDGQPYPNPVMELYTARPADGVAPAYTLEGDELGNVFTTEAMPFPDQALFVVVRSQDRTLRRQMPFPTNSGACNVCHRPGFGVQLELVP